jgi:hypothetical protein
MAGQMKVIAGSGNVFADLGFANADDMRLKAPRRLNKSA